VLDDRNLLSEVSIAERMSWAAHRQSTRIEDVAYVSVSMQSAS
jgi:hypothetical protein